jgi:hypothetical protein
MSSADEVLATIRRITAVCDALGLSWAVGGSFASAVYGEPRATNDVDVIARLRLGDVRRFVAALGEDVYVDEDVIREAITSQRSFNVIDETTYVKIDVFVPPPGPLGEGQLIRRRRLSLTDELQTWVLGPEDIVLQKLRWYRLGAEQSDRQWRDIGSVLRGTKNELDWGYLRSTAADTGLSDLLNRAERDLMDGA